MFEVQLAVYDLSRGMARQLSTALLGMQVDGIWHSGIVVYGQEYYFGGGIQTLRWGEFAQNNGLPPQEVLSLGTTHVSQREFEAHLRTLSSSYTQHMYDLIHNNCNHFADVVARFLTGRGIPSHIVDLPRIVFSSPGGAMLRPMVEAMQNNIRQQYSSLDPFGGSRAQTTTPSPVSSNSQAGPAFEDALSQSVTALAMNALQNMHAQPSQTSNVASRSTSTYVSGNAATTTVSATAAIERERKTRAQTQAFVSADASSLSKIESKLLAIDTLTDEQRTRLQDILRRLQSTAPSSSSSSSATSTTKPSSALFSAEDYLLVERLLATHSDSHTFSLSLLRLMFLHERDTNCCERLSVVRTVLQRLLQRRSDGSLEMQHSGESEKHPHAQSESGFASVPAHVMALCAMANLLSHDAGASSIVRESDAPADTHILTQTNTQGEGAVLGDLVDVVLNGLAHTRPEVRQMSAALAVNLSLALHREQQPTQELSGHAVQLLCGCCEGLQEETDAVVRERRLSAVAHIAQGAPAAAKELLQGLGLADALQTLRERALSLPQAEKEIVDELLRVCH